MRLLDRYQLRELLIALGYCLGAILVFWLSFELLGGMEDLRRKDLGFDEIALYLFHRLPLNLLLLLPVALLLAILYALTQHARHNEIVAMRAAGVSLWRIGLPYIVVSLFLGVGMFFLNEYAVPDAAARAEAVLERTSAGDAAARSWKQNLNFRDDSRGRIWSLRGFNVETGEIQGADIQWPTADGGRQVLIADRGRFENSAWVFERVSLFAYPPGAGALPEQSHTNRMVIDDFPETPAHLRSEVKIGRMLGSLKKSRQVQLSLHEIRTYRQLHHELPPQFDAPLRTWFHDRMASPWACLVVALIAIPAGVGSGRRAALVGVAGAIFLAFAYFVLKEFSLAAGSGGYLAPWVAAWLPNLAFGGAGLVAIVRLR